MDAEPTTRPSDLSAVPQARWTSHALEWGAASILIGVLILVIAPLGATAAAVGWFLDSHGRPHNDAFLRDVRVLIDVITLAIALLLGLAVLGLAFGVAGLWQARARRLPAGTAAAGVTICGFVVAVAVVALVVTLHSKRVALGFLEGELQEKLKGTGKADPPAK
jgi:hypothetical protein